MEDANKSNEYEKDSENRTSDKRLYDPKWFPLFSILTSFLGVAILYFINYGRKRDTQKREIWGLLSHQQFL